MSKYAVNPQTGEAFRLVGNEWQSLGIQKELASEGMGGIEKFLIGVGKEVTDLGRGAKQKYLMATDPEKAKAYTDEINQDERRWQENFPEIGAQTLGRAVGAVLPGALTPAAGLARTAALAGLESAMMPTKEPSWTETGLQGVVGAATGGVLSMIPPVIRGKATTPSTREASEGLQYAAEHELPLRPQDISSRPTDTILGNLSRGTVVPGLSGRDERVVKAMEEETWRVVDDFASRGNPNIQKALQERVDKLTQYEGQLYDAAYQRVGAAPVDAALVIKRVTSELEALQKQGGIKPGTIKRAMDTVMRSPPESDTVQGWRQWRTNMRETEKVFARKGYSMKPLEAVYDVVTDEIYKAAAKADPNGAQMLKRANDFTRSIRVPVTQGPLAGLNTSEAVQKLSNASPEQAAEYLRALSPANRQAAVSQVMMAAIDNASNAGRRGGFGPAEAARGLEKARNTFHAFMPADDAKAIDGLIAYLRTGQGAALDVANKPTGERLVALAPLAVAGVGTATDAGIGIGMTQLVIPFVMRDRVMKGLAQRLADAKPGTSRYDLLFSEFEKRLMGLARSGAVSAEDEVLNQPMKIEIRNGVRQ